MAVGGLFAFVVLACGSSVSGPETTRTSVVTGAAVASFAVDQVSASHRESVTGALSESAGGDSAVVLADVSFPPALVAEADLRSGGPGPDGIPSIDAPRFLHVANVDFLRDTEPVYVLELNGGARAYPLQIMTWHEIVNDTVGGIPVAVTYCPLCNSAAAYDRRHAGRVLSFGVSGLLWNSSLVMFDRQTRSLWGHFTGQGIAGVFAGVQLDAFPVTLSSWTDFKTAHPSGLVLSRDTGHPRSYGKNPYPGYDDINNPPFLFDGKVDGRYAAKTRMIGIDLDDRPVAVTGDRLIRDRVVAVTVGERHLVVWWKLGTASALDAGEVAAGRDVGSVMVFDAVVDARVLRFRPNGGQFEDAETGSRWDTFGTATSGPLAGHRLTAIAHVDTFWFAWAAFKPATEIIG